MHILCRVQLLVDRDMVNIGENETGPAGKMNEMQLERCLVDSD